MAGALALILCAGTGGALAQPGARAELKDAAGNTVGTATFTEVDGGVEVQVEVEGFTESDGTHGIHIHETGSCSPDFGAAGGHFNPAGLEHGLENPHGAHAGDLPNITIGAEGNRSYSAVGAGFTLDAEVGRLVLAGDGSALMIHAEADDNRTDPDGNSGGRVACGVIEAVNVTPQKTETREGEVFTAESNTLIPETERPTDERIAGLRVPEGFELNHYRLEVGRLRSWAGSRKLL